MAIMLIIPMHQPCQLLIVGRKLLKTSRPYKSAPPFCEKKAI